MGLIILIPLFAIMYYVIIRPQQKRLKEHQLLLSKVEVGDDIVTAGGIYGRVTELDGETLFLAVADGIELKITKESVAGLVSYEDESADEADEAEELVDDE